MSRPMIHESGYIHFSSVLDPSLQRTPSSMRNGPSATNPTSELNGTHSGIGRSRNGGMFIYSSCTSNSPYIALGSIYTPSSTFLGSALWDWQRRRMACSPYIQGSRWSHHEYAEFWCSLCKNQVWRPNIREDSGVKRGYMKNQSDSSYEGAKDPIL